MQSQDFNTMQNNAIEYAREMKKRASNYNKQQNKISDINHVYNNSENRNSSRKEYSRQNFSDQSEIKNMFNPSGKSNKNPDNDISLILALILLLSGDGGDRMLMLALLYIMT